MQLGTFVILSFLTHRITHFILKDKLIAHQRMWLLKKIAGVPKFDEKGAWTPVAWRQKLLELMQCWWCMSIWVGLGVAFVVNPWVVIPIPPLYGIALSSGALLWSDLIKGS